MNKRNSKENMLKEISLLENKVQLLFDAAISGIMYVGR